MVRIQKVRHVLNLADTKTRLDIVKGFAEQMLGHSVHFLKGPITKMLTIERNGHNLIIVAFDLRLVGFSTHVKPSTTFTVFVFFFLVTFTCVSVCEQNISKILNKSTCFVGSLRVGP